MAHVHTMRDSDLHFVVEPATRTIKSQSTKNILIQFDHNSEIFTFEMPREIEGHDMTKCNRVEIHYINNGGSGQRNTGVYEVSDFAISDDEPDIMVWSWTVSANATQLIGPLTFAFRFACVADDDSIEYAWSTAPYSGIVISEGIYNGYTVTENYIDILEQWANKIGVSVDDVNQDVESGESGGINVITLILSDGRKESFNVRNGVDGVTPVRGVDYWTDDDKEEIINDILEVMPEAEGVSF